MATEVDICNLSLAHLGDDATIASLSPPEGSAQAEQAARFYPIARDTLLDMHSWDFATRRASMALTTNANAQWKYAYASPNDMMNAVSIISPTADNDYATKMGPSEGQSSTYSPTVSAGHYVPQQYAVEIDSLGNYLIYTNQEAAVLRYQAKIENTSRFSPLFTMTLSWHLASMLAGPVVKGDAGAAESKRCTQVMSGYLQKAISSDVLNRDIKVSHIVPWTAGR
tara:strand:- start:2178 stop:2852 length:675 start_codon:yes stop_codon:yes gene_type:complete